MATYTITHDLDSRGFNETSVLKDVSAGQAFKVLTFIISAYECEVVECTPTRVLVRTPNSIEYSHKFEGNEKEMQALAYLALDFQKTPPARDHARGVYGRVTEFVRRALVGSKPPPGRIKRNTERVQNQTRFMFRLDSEPITDWPGQMKRVMAHLDDGKPVGPLT